MSFIFPADIEGYTSPAEAEALYDLACQTPEGGVIVELGTYKGRSAVSLAQSGRSVWAVDRFEPESAEFNPLPDHRDGKFTASLVKENAAKYGVHIRVIDADTQTAWRFWASTRGKPIHLLFIDADHDYEAVKADFEGWSQFVVEDGVVVFDDTLWPGVMQFLMELNDWAPIPGPQVGGLTAMKRIKETVNAR